MGNLCLRNKKSDDKENEEVTATTSPKDIKNNLVLKWEERQKERNLETLMRLREDFEHRPDNFILNMLAVSTQFYKNFNKERKEIANTIREREKHFNDKLSPYHRGVFYLGGYEEIAGTHVLYQDPENFMLELPTRLQLFIIQENIHVFGEDQLEELLTATYQDDEIPIYRLTEELAKRHPGYVRLRTSETIPGVTRSDSETYEDIYSFLPKPNENEPDPVMDIRPIRRSSVISQDEFSDLYEVNPGFENSQIDEETSSTSKQEWARRPSGVLPQSFEWKKNLNEEDAYKKERRPSGVFPKMNPGMERVSLKKSKPKKFQPGKEFDMLNELLSKIEEDEESEFSKKSSSESSASSSHESEEIYETLPLKDKNLSNIQNESAIHNRKDSNMNGELSFKIQNECFLNKKIKLRSVNDAYGIDSNSELRTYFSSNRYLDTFEEEFLILLEILQKDYLYDTCEMQTPAIHVQDIIVEKQGPKFNTEYIPSISVSRWPQSAFEWKWRSRKPKIDSDSQTIYKWPLEHKIQEVSEMGCNLVPIGYYNPKEPTKTMEIEWQIQFTKAEKALIRSLGHSQIRVLLLAEVLIRDHLGEKTQLRTQHLRYILFYMCEHNMKDWYEERLGFKLKTFLKSVYGCFSNENFPHYFVSKCNMIDSLPLKDLRFIQSTVKKMTENLPIYLMQTLHRLRMADDFYPRLDIKKLYKIVTPKHYHGNIAQSLIGIHAMSNTNEDGSSDENTDDEEDLELKKKLKAEYRRRQDKSQPQQKYTSRKKGINLDYKIQNLTDNRAEDVLKYFADHFLEMARKSNEFEAYPQAYMYILLAGNMATLLEDCNCSQEAAHYKEIIEQINSESREGIASIIGSSGKVAESQMTSEVVNTKTANVPNWEFKTQRGGGKRNSKVKEEVIEKTEIKKVHINTKNVAASLMALQNAEYEKTSTVGGDLNLPDNDSDLDLFESPELEPAKDDSVLGLKDHSKAIESTPIVSILKHRVTATTNEPSHPYEKIGINGNIPRPKYIKQSETQIQQKLSDTPSVVLRDLDLTLASVEITNFQDESISNTKTEESRNINEPEESESDSDSIDSLEMTKL